MLKHLIIKISDTLEFFLVTTVSVTIFCASAHGLELKAANVDTVNIEPAHNALAAPLIINTLPVERTLDGIFLAEEETISAGPSTLDLDFYRNTAYACGFSGNYTFLVVEPRDKPGTEAPLWVFLHGGGAGYFDEQQTYRIGVNPVTGASRNPNQHNIEKTLAGLRDGQLFYRTTNNNGGVKNSTITRRIMEGYRILIVSMCDHDLHAGMGTSYLNNPNGGEVNGLQANMAAIDYTVSKYPTTHVFAHGTSAGSIGAFALAYSYNFEGISLNGIIMDSHLISERTETLIDSLAGVPGFVFGADFQIAEASEKIGYFGNKDYFGTIEDEINNYNYSVPTLDIFGPLDPGCGGGLPRIAEAAAAGLDNCEWVHEGFRQTVELSPDSIHQVRKAIGFGHVPTHEDGIASDFVDDFLLAVMANDPPYPFANSAEAPMMPQTFLLALGLLMLSLGAVRLRKK